MKREQNVILHDLTRKLMHDVYHAFSACVWLDERGEILDLYQFDTGFCELCCTPPPNAHSCYLISNHEDGNMRPFDEDMRNWKRLQEEFPHVACRLLIYSEDEGILELI